MGILTSPSPWPTQPGSKSQKKILSPKYLSPARFLDLVRTTFVRRRTWCRRSPLQVDLVLMRPDVESRYAEEVRVVATKLFLILSTGPTSLVPIFKSTSRLSLAT